MSRIVIVILIKSNKNHRTQRILCSFFIALISQHVSAPNGGHHQVSLQSYNYFK
jgi:hypothetical protein